MLKLRFLCVLLWPLYALSSQTTHTVDLSAAIEDWNLVDLNGDDKKDVVAIVFTDDGRREFRIALQEKPNDFRKLPAVLCPADVITYAFGNFLRPKSTDVLLIASDHAAFLRVTDGTARIDPCDAKFEHVFRVPSGSCPSLWHWPIDIDADGHDDFYLPTDDGIQILWGNGDGTFAPQRTDGPIRSSCTVDRISEGAFDLARSFPRPVFADVTGDSLREIAWFDETGLQYLPQTSARKFADQPTTFGLSWLAGAAATGIVEQTDVDLVDLDGNGKADLLLTRMQSKEGSIVDMQSTLVALLNNDTPTAFGREPAFALKLKGVVGFGPKIVDIDADGRSDLVYGTYAGGITDALARVFSMVPVTLYAHRGTSGKSPFATVAEHSIKISLSNADFERWGARTSIALHVDFDGDGSVDYLSMAEDDGKRSVLIRAGEKSDGKFKIGDRTIMKFRADGMTDASFRTLDAGKKTTVILERPKSLEFITAP